MINDRTQTAIVTSNGDFHFIHCVRAVACAWSLTFTHMRREPLATALHCSAPPARHVQHNYPSNNSEILINEGRNAAHQHASLSSQSAPPVTPETLTCSVTNWCRRLRCACAPTTVQVENWRYTLHHLAIVLRRWRHSCVNEGCQQEYYCCSHIHLDNSGDRRVVMRRVQG